MSKKNRNKPKSWVKPRRYPASNGGATLTTVDAGASEQADSGSPAATADDLGTMSEQQLVDTARAETEASSPVTADPGDSTTASATPEAAVVIADSAVTMQVSKEDLIEAIRGLRRASAEFNVKKAETEVARFGHEREKEAVSNKVEELGRRETVLKEREADVSGRNTKVESRELELLAKAAEADAGFPERLREAREALEAEYKRGTKELKGQKTLLKEQQDAFDTDRQSLGKEQIDIERDKREISYKREHMKDMEQLVEQQATKKVEDQLAALGQGIESSKNEVRRVSGQLTKSQVRVNELEASLAKAGGTSLEDLIAKRDHLSKKVESLEMELSTRPGQATVKLYKEAQGKVEVLEDKNRSLGAALFQSRSELERMKIPVGEMETQRVAQRSLELRNAALKEANDQLQIEVEGRLNQASGRNPYPELEQMDAADSECQKPPTNLYQQQNLKGIVTYVRNRMAADEKLFYDESTIRCFLAGLAMSRLHLLQGISGTGKTSLPRAFAQALGGHADIVAVQAGWRDRQDLLGYYNAFDKKYHESSFVKALYRAQCPTWADRIYIIVLDEMNLSYIEQFGADLLSELESPTKPNHPQFGLMDSRPPKRPSRLLDDGTAIAVPPNVWFVGTANHDETTKDFADKTYDRAHTMELPRNPSTLKLENVTVHPPSSCDSIQRLFTAARQEKTSAIAADFVSTFVKKLEPELKGKFNIGWGNRLEKQIAHFVPVIVSAGGTVGEATDHVVATKLLRKLRNRHDVRVRQLNDLRTTLQTRWKEGKLDPAPKQCEDLLDALIRTRSFEEGEAAS